MMKECTTVCLTHSPQHLTGFELFTRVRFRRQLGGRPVSPLAPFPYPPPPLVYAPVCNVNFARSRSMPVKVWSNIDLVQVPNNDSPSIFAGTTVCLYTLCKMAALCKFGKSPKSWIYCMHTKQDYPYQEFGRLSSSSYASWARCEQLTLFTQFEQYSTSHNTD